MAIKGFLTKKLGMTQEYRQDGSLVATTILSAEPCLVVGVKNQQQDGYFAVGLGVGKKRKGNKPLSSFLKKLKIDQIPAWISEVAVDGSGDLPKIGDQIGVETVLSAGQKVNIVGVSKGRGFAGVIKRWNFHSQPKTRGQSDRERAPGSIGPQTPGRVIKGKKMPGHLGNHRATVRNLEVLWVDADKKQIALVGGVPGPTGAWLKVVLKDNG
ncbi:MAG: 50S ribosomal protein L3 [Patescibacteria group bacterium]